MTYQYECRNCGQELEAEQRIVDDPLELCPKCGEKALQRIIPKRGEHGNGFVLNGGVWARDGYSG